MPLANLFSRLSSYFGSAVKEEIPLRINTNQGPIYKIQRGEEILRHPAVSQAYRNLQHASGLRPDIFANRYGPIVVDLAGYFQCLPGAEYIHHTQDYGLLIHSLEVATNYLAIKEQRHIIGPPLGAKRGNVSQDEYFSDVLYITSLFALTHDIGKIRENVRLFITDPSGKPIKRYLAGPTFDESLADVLETHPDAYFRFEWIQGRWRKKHECPWTVIAPTLLRRSNLSINPEVRDAYVIDQTNTNQSNFIHSIKENISKADTQSTVANKSSTPEALNQQLTILLDYWMYQGHLDKITISRKHYYLDRALIEKLTSPTKLNLIKNSIPELFHYRIILFRPKDLIVQFLASNLCSRPKGAPGYNKDETNADDVEGLYLSPECSWNIFVHLHVDDFAQNQIAPQDQNQETPSKAPLIQEDKQDTPVVQPSKTDLSSVGQRAFDELSHQSSPPSSTESSCITPPPPPTDIPRLFRIIISQYEDLPYEQVKEHVIDDELHVSFADATKFLASSQTEAGQYPINYVVIKDLIEETNSSVFRLELKVPPKHIILSRPLTRRLLQGKSTDEYIEADQPTSPPPPELPTSEFGTMYSLISLTSRDSSDRRVRSSEEGCLQVSKKLFEEFDPDDLSAFIDHLRNHEQLQRQTSRSLFIHNLENLI